MIKKIINTFDLDFKNLLSKSFSTTIVKIVGKFSGLVLSVLLARILGASDLGTINLANQIIAIVLVIAMLGMRIVLIRDVAINFGKGLYDKIAHLINSTYIANGLFAFFLSAIIFIFSDFIGSTIFSDDKLVYVLMIFAIAITPQIFTRIHSYCLLGVNKIWQSNLAEETLSSFFTLMLLALLYLLNINLSLINVAFTYVISRLIISLFLFLFWRKILKLKVYFTNNFLKYISKAGPFFIISLIGIIQARFDILIIGYFLSPSDIAVYVVIMTLALIPSFFLQVFESAASPKIAKFYNDNDLNKMAGLVQKISFILFIIGLLTTLMFVFFGKILLSIWGGEFVFASNLLIFLSLAQLFNMLSGISAMILVMSGQEKLRRNLAIITLILHLIFSVYLIKNYGMAGAVISNSIIAIIINIALIFLVKNKLNFWVFKFYKL